MTAELGVTVRAVETVREAVAEADVVCTVTSAAEPILRGEWVRAGTHVNVVGSGIAGPAEVDNELVRRSRFFVDSREGVLAQGAEFLRAKAAGVVGDEHIVAEIGQVLAGDVVGRRSTEEITVYKSLGHVVQDLACGWALYLGSDQGASRSQL
jgi:ornithine cyclodeaminase/alanine dehydrogenase-like protein (mu-crystallin family)